MQTLPGGDNRQVVPTLLVLALAVGLAVSLWKPLYPHEQKLQHVPTVVALGCLYWSIRRGVLSTGSFACLAIFLALHIVGARYIYSYTPYDDWIRAITGSSPADWFGWQRNHYDRFVHFAFGALFVRPTAELAVRYGGMSRSWGTAFGVLSVLGASLVYEVAEWLLTLVASPLDAEAYNGQQGDFWDAQKDMALAAAGALVAAAWGRRPRLPVQVESRDPVV